MAHLLIDEAAAVAAGTAILAPGPAIDPRAGERLVVGLHGAARRAEPLVREVTRLDQELGAPVRVVDRSGWLRLNVAMVTGMLTAVSATPTRPAGPFRRLAARVNGAQLGAVLSVLAPRILGQWLPFLPEPYLVMVAPNVARTESEMRVRPRDFRLWVCLHEQTHQLQFTQAPWLREHLLTLAAGLFSEDESQGDDATPGTVLEAALSPGQRNVLSRVGVTMSVLEGYADVMMDRVGPRVIPSIATLRRRLDARRARGGWRQVLTRWLGMDLKLAQYREGARFCRIVIGRVGVDGLNAVYAGPEQLPTPDELRDPARWITRVHA